MRAMLGASMLAVCYIAYIFECQAVTTTEEMTSAENETETTAVTTTAATTVVTTTTIPVRGLECYNCTSCKNNKEATEDTKFCEVGEFCQSRFAGRNLGGSKSVVKRCTDRCLVPGHNFAAGRRGIKYCCDFDLCNKELAFRTTP